ncbi:MAG: hypothetical protein AAGA61_02385 [Pseudomonadota bacterium]
MIIPRVPLLMVAVLIAPDGAAHHAPLADYAVARIATGEVVEASGLACHEADAGRVWVMNDGGSEPVVYAVALDDGSDQGRIHTTASNVDWEDMTVLRDGENEQIVIGDIGDNGSNRDFVALYRLDEPTGATRELRFTYPEGSRDAEAIAIDARDGMAYVLTKRTLPAELYALPLEHWGRPEPVSARYLGPVNGLPLPSSTDRLLAHTRRSWHWQPTAMDISPDGSRIAILTYAAIYLFERGPDTTVGMAVQAPPRVFDLDGLRDGESLCLTSQDVVITTEGTQPRLFRIPFADAGWRR